MGDLDDIERHAREEGRRKFDALSTNEQIGRLLSQRGRTQETLRDATARAGYFGNRESADFDAEARDGNRTAADRASRELTQIDAQLAQRGVIDIEREKKDYVSKIGRHQVR